MTPDAIDTLLAILASASVVGRLEETAPEVWEAALADISDQDGLRAAQQLIRTHHWVKIADIVDAVRRNREDVARDLYGPGQFAEIPDADPDDIQAYLAALREQRTRAAIGADLTHRPALEAMIKTVGQNVPNRDVQRPGPLGQHCPTCYAPVGRPCKTPGGRERAAHQVRQAAAGMPGVEQPLSPDQAAVEEARRRQAARIHLAGGAA